jgi:Fungal protein kinase
MLTATGYTFKIKPDLAVFTKRNEAREDYVAIAEFFIEFKCRVDPFVTTRSTTQPQEETSCSITKSSEGRKTLGQIATYIAAQMDLQYRTHTFFVLVMKKYARLMRWDRSGAIFTKPINYNSQPELFEFFQAYNEATPEARGIDEFVTEPTPVEIADARQTCPDLGESLLVVSIHNPKLHAQPHRYVINRPSPRSSLFTGRSTRTSVAYDMQERKRVFFKDSWRVIASNAPVEGEVYRSLNQCNVSNIPTCVDYCDVGAENYHQTQVQSFVQSGWVPHHRASFTVYRHHRVVLGTVGKKLEDFASTKEMVRAVRDALVGMSLLVILHLCVLT